MLPVPLWQPQKLMLTLLPQLPLVYSRNFRPLCWRFALLLGLQAAMRATLRRLRQHWNCLLQLLGVSGVKLRLTLKPPLHLGLQLMAGLMVQASRHPLPPIASLPSFL